MSDAVPKTYYSIGELVNANESLVDTWRLRLGDDRSVFDVGSYSMQEVLAQVRRLPQGADFAVQEYVRPMVSGAAYIWGGMTVLESIRGPCTPLLRQGAEGSLWLSDQAGSVVDTCAALGDLDESHELPIRDISELFAAAVSASAPGTLGDGSLLEWIVASSGRLFFVDLKYLDGYIAGLVRESWDFWICQRHPGSPIRSFPDTALGNVDELDALGVGYIHCRSGSALSHFCVEAFGRGISVRVSRGN